ncbi:TRAP transporter permease [Ruegeria atlantica]|uniref:TRAP transporter permease n=1 Tax=Ruegeria atlantica TaxID=81569 RepID=UPI00148146FA|nr:TRAP transporter fused permease subunit [Ruegeria atlantica]
MNEAAEQSQGVGINKRVAYVLGGILTLFLVYTAGFGTMTDSVQRGLPLMIAFAIIFLTVPIKATPSSNGAVNSVLFLINALFFIANILSITYIIWVEDDLVYRLGNPNTWDVLAFSAGFLCVVEAARRVTPPAFFWVVMAFIAYALFGNYIPGNFGHPGYPIGELVSYLYFSNEGIFGLALNVMVNVIFIFLLFGTMVEVSGLGNSIVKIGLALVGRLRGGPALSAIFASGLFGSISGSGASNVLTTGTFTIPLMSKVGYRPAFAGAVEAVASTGGHIVPPIMASTVFVMAEIIGVPYIQIAAAAAIPALLYYMCLFAIVYLRAHKDDIQPIPVGEAPSLFETLKKGGIFFLPVGLLILLLMRGFTPTYSCFYSVVFMLALMLLTGKPNRNPKAYLDICDTTARNSLMLFGCLASIGIIIGIIALTGVGVKFSILVSSIAEANLFYALTMAMVAAMILSMGMPVLPAYLLVVVVSGTALQKLGLTPLASHMFVFYFASLAGITPPVCISAYTAAGIAGSNPVRTAMLALWVGSIGFVIPYMFAYNPALLLMGTTSEILWVTSMCLVGIASFALCLEGYLRATLHIISRGIFLLAGLMLIFPDSSVNLIGLGTFAACFVVNFVFSTQLGARPKREAQ